ncbi:MAG: helix-turn-helix transcriptional regulator, partial [Chloroflexota bacterium]
PIPVLSQKDVQVLRFIQLGLTNKAIAQKVGVGLHTVRNRFVRICKKLGANGRIEAITKATEYGFLDYYY